MKKYLFIIALSLGLFWGSQAKAAESPIASTKATEALVTAFSFNTDGTLDVSVDKLTVDNIVIDGDSITNASNDITIGNITISALTNSDGIVFSSLGTATIGIDFSPSGLSGATDYLWWFNSSINLSASGTLKASSWDNGNYVILKSTQAGGSADTRVTYPVSGNFHFETSSLKQGFLYGDMSIGGITNATSNGTTTIVKTTHGLSLAAGDMAFIVDSSTAADEGVYRVVSDDGSNIVVDRALGGSDADVDITFYKNIIYFGGTDGTNGQRIMNYSHQDKPLQFGGDTLSAANAAMGSEDIVIGNHIEVKGLTFVSSSTFTFTTEGDITDPLPSTQLLLDGDNDTENDTIDLQDGEAAGQLLTLIAAVDIDADDTVTINFADTTATNAPAVVFDKVGENAELEWTGTTWIVKSLQTSL